MDGNLDENEMLPPPPATAAGLATPSLSPIVPHGGANMMPQLATRRDSAPAIAFVASSLPRRPRSRTRVYTIGALLFLAISVAGYLGFRSYIYGDDAPPIPVLDDGGG